MSENIDKILLQKGDYLCREGDESHAIFYVVNGVLAIHKRQGDKNAQVGTVYAGEVLGEMSFLTGELRYASVKATGDAEVLVLKTYNLENQKKKVPVWMTTLMATLIDRLNRQNNRIKI